jgi:hypothetical protein
MLRYLATRPALDFAQIVYWTCLVASRACFTLRIIQRQQSSILNADGCAVRLSVAVQWHRVVRLCQDTQMFLTWSSSTQCHVQKTVHGKASSLTRHQTAPHTPPSRANRSNGLKQKFMNNCLSIDTTLCTERAETSKDQVIWEHLRRSQVSEDKWRTELHKYDAISERYCSDCCSSADTKGDHNPPQ